MFAVTGKKERASRGGLPGFVGAGQTEDIFAGGEATGPDYLHSALEAIEGGM